MVFLLTFVASISWPYGIPTDGVTFHVFNIFNLILFMHVATVKLEMLSLAHSASTRLQVLITSTSNSVHTMKFHLQILTNWFEQRNNGFTKNSHRFFIYTHTQTQLHTQNSMEQAILTSRIWWNIDSRYCAERDIGKYDSNFLDQTICTRFVTNPKKSHSDRHSTFQETMYIYVAKVNDTNQSIMIVRYQFIF